MLHNSYNYHTPSSPTEGLERECVGMERRFWCPSGQCVDVASLCDGHRDCSDGADEDRTLCMIRGATGELRDYNTIRSISIACNLIFYKSYFLCT